MSILETITDPQSVRGLTAEQDRQLCEEIRAFLIGQIPKTGGHLASNLGVVELTIAIHKVFDTAEDRLVFDVGHQSYVHKLLTGRREGFDTLRSLDGLSGFPKPCESVHDAFIAGHASNAVSVALGLARARTKAGKRHSVIALMGDGALTGGLAYEGLNDAGESGEPLIVILNDNAMSITRNVGAVAKHLALLRLKPSYFGIKKAYRRFTKWAPGGRYLYAFTHALKARLKRFLLGTTIFEEMGFAYLGPVDGHDLKKLTYLLQEAREMQCPVVIHAITKKGKGFPDAEEHPERFHGLSAPSGAAPTQSFSAALGEELMRLAEQDERICAVTAAMPDGTGLRPFAAKYPDRLLDVGIAEGHAVSMAAGLAAGGQIPVVAVYSTFLQRAFDMLLHDTALMQNHVVFCVDRAGLVGEDGETHHGVFDVGFLRQVPGMTVLCPATPAELRRMLRQAIYEITGPVAIRYPRGSVPESEQIPEDIVNETPDLTIACYGADFRIAREAAALLQKRGVTADVIRLRCIKPLEPAALLNSARRSGRLLVAEQAVSTGCVGQELAAILKNEPVQLQLANLGDRFVTHGSNAALLRRLGLDAEGLCSRATEVFDFE